MEMVVTTGAIRRAKLQSECHHQWGNTQLFLQAGCPSCHPINSVRARKTVTISLPRRTFGSCWSSGFTHQVSFLTSSQHCESSATRLGGRGGWVVMTDVCLCVEMIRMLESVEWRGRQRQQLKMRRRRRTMIHSCHAVHLNVTLPPRTHDVISTGLSLC